MSGIPRIVIHPGRIGGKPTIGETRLSAILVAETYYQHGADEVKAMWDHLTDAEIIVCCWYAARYGTRKHKAWWKEWLNDADYILWSSQTRANCPWPPTRPRNPNGSWR